VQEEIYNEKEEDFNEKEKDSIIKNEEKAFVNDPDCQEIATGTEDLDFNENTDVGTDVSGEKSSK
jgi:hypothetical protein